MRGRPPKPNALKALSGEHRPSQLRTEPQPAELEPQPPDWLTEPQRAVWDRVTEDLDAAGIAFRIDTDAIAGYCSSVALLAQAERALAEGDGPIKADRDGTERRNPWLLVRQSALDGVHRFGSVLGMCPAARTHLGVTMGRTPEDDLAAQLLSHPSR